MLISIMLQEDEMEGDHGWNCGNDLCNNIGYIFNLSINNRILSELYLISEYH